MLPLARISFERVQNRALTSQEDGATRQVLEDVIKAFHENMSELDKIFKKYLPKDGSSWARNAWTAIASFNQDERVNAITADVMRLVQVLSVHIEATSPTTEEIASIVTGDLSSHIDQKIQGMILDIEVSSR